MKSLIVTRTRQVLSRFFGAPRPAGRPDRGHKYSRAHVARVRARAIRFAYVAPLRLTFYGTGKPLSRLPRKPENPGWTKHDDDGRRRRRFGKRRRPYDFSKSALRFSGVRGHTATTVAARSRVYKQRSVVESRGTT